jgi:molybdopterin converting factor small subunit
VNVQVKLFGPLRKYSDPDSPGHLRVELPAGSTVADLVSRIANQRGEVAACAVNGRTRKLDTVIQEGDVVMLLSRLGGG